MCLRVTLIGQDSGQGDLHMANNTSTALITGGTSGIGRATANKLTQLGIHVVVVGRNADRGKKTVGEIRAAGGKADFIASDLRDAASAREVARKAIELGSGHVDIRKSSGVFSCSRRLCHVIRRLGCGCERSEGSGDAVSPSLAGWGSREGTGWFLR
jgi:hypothetical protein